MPNLSSKVVIVTGASRGIGEAIARRFAADGAAVAVTARTVEEGDTLGVTPQRDLHVTARPVYTCVALYQQNVATNEVATCLMPS